MTDEVENYNSILSPLSALSATDSDLGTAVPEDGRTVIVFDENVFGLAVSNGINEIFSNFDILKVDSVTFSGATDTQISDTLSRKNWRTIFITADSGDSFPTPSDSLSIIRFSNNNISTDTQLFLLWSLTQTKGFKDIEKWFGKDIRVGTQSVYYIADGERGETKTLFTPHPNSAASKKWLPPQKISASPERGRLGRRGLGGGMSSRPSA